MKKLKFFGFITVMALLLASALFLFQGDEAASARSEVAAPAEGQVPVPETGTVAEASSGCGSFRCGSASGSASKSCCASQGSSASAGERIEQLRAYLTDYFTRTAGEGITVEVKDLGCHQEAEVKQAGKLIKKLSINGNSITEIS